MKERTNVDATVSSYDRSKVKYRVSLRYKQFYIEEVLLNKTAKNAVVHFLFVLSRAMKRDGGCPFYYKIEEVRE